MTEDIKIESLRKSHTRESFDCGENSLNQYLRQYARQSGDTGLGRTFVAVTPDTSEVLGYYTIASGNISFEIVPSKLPRYPVPVVHLGRLAVSISRQGGGLGELLLLDCFRRSLQISAEIGIYAIELSAKTDRAKRFYMRYGFSELTDDDLHLYVSIDTIRRSGLIKTQ